MFICESQWDEVYIIPTLCIWWRRGEVATKVWVTFHFLGWKIGVTWFVSKKRREEWKKQMRTWNGRFTLRRKAESLKDKE